jgi:DNA repair protein SbcC/Rad50
MRPLRLDLAGFTVFRDPTVVDFTDADFFALVGPTGSGKSTILDAMCFALYGTVPRWGDRRAIANALAPSAAEARVRLVFESAGARYAATRVVRRDGKGRVATSHAGLELLPKGFDLSTLDSGEATELGEPLAGTPGELDAAVLDAVGLPYEQFTTCVVLPQGAFAEFLHAKPAVRQQILVNLLGLSVYERVREQATALAAQHESRAAANDRLLAELADASDEAIAAACARVEAVRGLASGVEAAVPDLVDAATQARAAQTALADLDGELDLLGRVSRGAAAQEAAGQVAAAVLATARAAHAAVDAVTAAEEREEKLRGELADAGDAAALRRLLDDYGELDRLTAQAGDFAGTVSTAEAEYEAAIRSLDAASEGAAQAAAAVDAAARGVEEARTADRAATLRPHLRLGEPCPVCEQTVAELPTTPHSPALAAANARLERARAGAEAAKRTVAERDMTTRNLDRALAAVRAERDQLALRAAQLSARLTRTADRDAVRADLDAVGALQIALDEAALAVRAAREAHRRAAAAANRAQERERAAWREFDGVRDALGTLGPPPVDRDNLATAWQDLAGWSSSEVETREARRAELAAALRTARAAAESAAQRIARLFAGAGLSAPTTQPTIDPAAFSQAAAVAVERAQAAHARLVERREQADRLGKERDTELREAQVAKALAGHLRANNFERWLLAEALDLLVEGASRILRELTAGQYDLVHDKGEFFVVDHHDAGLRRGVRTLSGGETFQASLALALALSEQLAGLSTGVASLESIVLDEGFGTLDAATLETVAATLENLAARGDRMVGVVTHVGALAERIPVRFEVRKDARTAHVERVSL